MEGLRAKLGWLAAGWGLCAMSQARPARRPPPLRRCPQGHGPHPTSTRVRSVGWLRWGSQPKSPATSLSLSFSHTTSLTSRHLVSVLRIRVGLQLPRRRLYPLSRRSWSPPPHGTLTVSTTSCFQKSLAGKHFGNDHTTNNLLATSCYPISPRLICSSQVHSEDMTGSSRLHPT